MKNYKITVRDKGTVYSQGNTPIVAFEKQYPNIELQPTDDSFNANVCIELVGGKRNSKKYYTYILKTKKETDTVSELMSKIDRQAEKNESRQQAEQKAAQQEYDNYIKQISKLKNRIQDAIKLINHGLNKGILTDDYGWASGGSYSFGDFKSDGISHLIGVIGRRSNHYDYLGIENGGACGDIDFYTNGTDTFGVHEQKGVKVPPRIQDLKNFVNGFDAFESALHEYIKTHCS